MPWQWHPPLQNLVELGGVPGGRRKEEARGACVPVNFACTRRLGIVEGTEPRDMQRPKPESLLFLALARFAGHVWRGHLASPAVHCCPGCLCRIRQAGFSSQSTHLIGVFCKRLCRSGSSRFERKCIFVLFGMRSRCSDKSCDVSCCDLSIQKYSSIGYIGHVLNIRVSINTQSASVCRTHSGILL